jgi:hypothetical protein
MPIAATGQIEIDDAAISSGAFVPLEDPAVTGFRTTYAGPGFRHEWVLGEDAYTLAGEPRDRQLGLRFDSAGPPRFDVPATTLGNLGRFSDLDDPGGVPFPTLTIWDDGDFDLVFADVDTMTTTGSEVEQGDIVRLSLLAPGTPHTPLANFWNIGLTDGQDAGGVLLISPATVPEGPTTVIPLPATGLLLLGGLAAVAALRGQSRR